MSSSHSRPAQGMFAAFAIVAGMAVAALAQSNQPPARFTAVAMDLERGGATQIQIVVNRWTSEDERNRLMNVMFDEGATALLEALRRTPKVGYLQTPPDIGWTLYFAQQTPGEDGGERIMLITDRQIGFSETWSNARSVDYPFTVVEIQLKKNGEGEGTLSMATKIIPDKDNNIVVLENYDLQRIRLTQVKRTSANR